MERKYAKKHNGSFVGKQKMFYIFHILFQEKEHNGGKFKPLTTKEITLLLLRISGKETDVEKELINTRAVLHFYKKWGYFKKFKDDKWGFDVKNFQNIKFIRRSKGKGVNRIDWKYQQLLEMAVQEKWPINPDYRMEI